MERGGREKIRKDEVDRHEKGLDLRLLGRHCDGEWIEAIRDQFESDWGQERRETSCELARENCHINGCPRVGPRRGTHA